VNLDILDGDVANCDSRLSLADTFSEWIKHAPWPIPVRFFHLLRTDIYGPPNRLVHCEIFEIKIFYNTCSLMAWIRFHVNGLDGPDHLPVDCSDISDAISTC